MSKPALPAFPFFDVFSLRRYACCTIGRAISEGQRVVEPRIQYAQTKDGVSIASEQAGT